MEAQRGIWARLGLTALNWIAPGISLFRLGAPLAGLSLMALALVPTLLAILWFRLGSPPGYQAYVGGLLLFVLGTSVVLLASIVLTWRRSRTATGSAWWSRWPTVIGILVVFLVLLGSLQSDPLRPYRAFYIPSDAMIPTLAKNSRLAAAMNPNARLRRGDLVLVEAPGGHIYVKRVAALAGDEIEMTGGVVSLNGQVVAQRPLGSMNYEEGGMFGRTVKATRHAERFPGEAREHRILDQGYLGFDDFPRTRVRPGHIFMLGDNRDASADSRVSIDEGGLEQVPIGKVRGIALFTTWGGPPDQNWSRLYR